MKVIDEKDTLKVVGQVTDYYLKSRDFNGLPLAALRKSCTLEKSDIKHLIETGKIDVHFGYGHPNPHVKALPLGSIENQLITLEGIDNSLVDTKSILVLLENSVLDCRLLLFQK